MDRDKRELLYGLNYALLLAGSANGSHKKAAEEAEKAVDNCDLKFGEWLAEAGAKATQAVSPKLPPVDAPVTPVAAK